MLTKLRDKKAFGYIFNFLRTIFWIIVLLFIILAPASIIEIFKGKNLKETFFEMIEGLKVIGGFYLVILLISIPFLLVGLLIGTAIKNKKGKAYPLVEFINGVSILILILVGSYFVINGLSVLYKMHLQIFITVICAAAYAFYYWYKKNHT